MFNPNRARHILRLKDALDASRRQLRPQREHRMAGLAEFVGAYYGDSGTKWRVPVNFINLAIGIYTNALAGRNPAFSVTTPHPGLRASAANLKLALNRAVEDMNLVEAVQDTVLEAMFGMGVMKVGLKRSSEDARIDPGQVYAEAIDFSDWVHDTSAKHMDATTFQGNRYQLPADVLADDPLLAVDLKDLPEVTKSGVDQDGEDRSEKLSIGDAGGRDDAGLEPMYELWDLFIRRERLIVTLEAQTGKLLKVVEYDGQEMGPYHWLGFQKVPGNVLPLPPVALLRDLHEFANNLFIKAAQQAERQKTVTGYRASSAADAKRVVDSEDGDTIRMDNPDYVREFNFGGTDAKTLAMFLNIKDQINRFGGNLDALGGLAPQSGTLGQDELLTSSANGRILAMEDRKNRFVRGVGRDIAWYLWTDPLIAPTLTRRIPNTNLEISTAWTPEQRQGKFLDYNFSIKAFAMQQQGPAQRYAALRAYLNEGALPLLPAMQAQGLTLNAEGWLREFADCLNIDSVDSLFEFAAGAQQPGPGPTMSPDAAKMPATTTRRYERVNRPGATPSGKDEALTNALMGVGQQKSQAAAIGRDVS